MLNSGNNAAGSEWRKWDLHVHTPASVLNNGFGADWDSYVQKLFKTLLEKDITVVGITDYFSIAGYKKIVQDYLPNNAKLQTLFTNDEISRIKAIKVLPNVEFRSDIFVGSTNSINFHVLFSDEVEIRDIEEGFLHEIDFLYEGDPQQEDKKRKLKEANLIELGQRLKAQHANFASKGDLEVGTMSAVVSHKQISEVLSNKASIFGEKYLFAAVADEDLSEISWDSRDHLTRKVLIQKSDLLFSSNKKTRSWALGEAPYTGGVNKYIEEFKSLKPCIHGSDAHSYDFIGHPCSKRGDSAHDCNTQKDQCDLKFCWIKADPTFEGLKQVVFEPGDRVVIQTANPKPLKSSQVVAGFHIEEANLESGLSFKNTDLPFNEGLVSVVGGKGSGKTALVDLIANMYEDRADCDDKNSFVRRISDSDNPKNLNTSIKLESGEEFKKEVKAQSFVEDASIVYVAQGELERHVEDPAHLEKFINDLIFQSISIKDSELLFDYQNLTAKVADINGDINDLNKKLLELEKITDPKISTELEKDGKKLGIELKDTEKKIAELKKDQSAEKIKEAEDKQKQLTELRDKKDQLTNLGLALKEAIKFSQEGLVSFNEQIVEINELAKKLKYRESFKAFVYEDTEKLQALINTARTDLKAVVTGIGKFQKELEDKEKSVKEHTKLLDKKKELEKAIKANEDKIKLIEQNRDTLKKEKAKRDTKFKELVETKLEERDQYITIIKAFSENKSDILGDLEFNAELIFNRDRFMKAITEIVDNRKMKVELNDSESDIFPFMVSLKELVNDPQKTKAADLLKKHKELFEKVVQKKREAVTVTLSTVYQALFGDYFSVVPAVKYKKTALSKLSMGQKATVLIKIYLAEGEKPILIDSHDDHLDNEFIMDELVKALRQAKEYRQVIIVSNNGNVVVNSDSEQIIIACRDEAGEISYLSGSLENQTLRPKLLSVLEGGEEAFSKRQQKYRLLK